ncbi:hypothetical protein BVE84_04005 [Streptococcus azizii]|uniref:Transposase n=1 Tax=Streptococcus azizii TaxID=1579424 RepID=A0AB36JS75_9STRE|nr:hypothetical protein BVE86_02920 [Streptococcus azizii]ONK28946.1 hypothetical protein BVE85_03650 [Streptococcus azizii]ONK30229.1 hypothetical protein BVE84_04005 [Streptococcus azizii]
MLYKNQRLTKHKTAGSYKIQRALSEQSKNRSFDEEPQVLGKTIFFVQLVAHVQLVRYKARKKLKVKNRVGTN